MRRALKVVALATILCGVAWAQGKETVQLAEPWYAPYTGQDATGDHVVGLWSFDAGAELTDGSGNGHDLTLNGAKVVAGGRFGGCLESRRGWPDKDIAHQARAKAAPELTPKGAFTVEMWIKPKSEIEGYAGSFLLDNRYVDESGMQFILSADSGAGRLLQMVLGIAGEHPTWFSDRCVFGPGVWYHVAFTYDGKGSGRFYVNGMARGGQDRPEYGVVTPGVKYLSIGDRVGSYYHGFPGYIDQVRICKGVLEFSHAVFKAVSLRRVFVRMETETKVRFALINKQRKVMSGAKVSFLLGGIPQLDQPVPDLKPGQQHIIDLAIDTSLRPDTYRLTAAVHVPGESVYRNTQEFKITIVPRKIPHTMPMVMWGGSRGDIDWLTKLGFTHYLVNWVDFSKVWESGKPSELATTKEIKKTFTELDEALARGMGVVAGLSPGRWARKHEELRRIGANGKHPSDDVCGLFPELPKFCYNVGASLSAAYGNHPAMQSAMVHTEVRGDSRLCYHEHDRKALKAATGLDDIPKGLAGVRGTQYKNIPNFPANRVIPDNYPMYVYYKWFWKEGDGWNAMHTGLHNGLKSGGHDHLWTFHDPAVRVPSVYGNGGDVDYLSHWTYVYPDPIRIGLCTDELFCMAGGARRDDQQVMKMTQIIWYRSQTAPEPGEKATSQSSDFIDQDVRVSGTGQVDASGRYRAKWEQENPDARFITIAPMQLREAMWCKLSRPIKGIMYHGW
ncbi:MAG: LamG domain-containing protein, partial [Planctomycetota bacterium]